MKKIIIVLLMIYSVTSVSANDNVDIDKLEREAQERYLEINNFYELIHASEQRGALEILNHYRSPKARLIQLWLLIVFQKYDSLENYNSKLLSHFINNSRGMMASYLGQLQFDPEQALSEKDYAAIKQQINKIIEHSESNSEILLNHTYIAIENAHLRKLPIVLKITKQQDDKGKTLIVKKKELVKLLYHIEYQNQKNQIARWAYIETETHRYGWINLRLISKIEGL